MKVLLDGGECGGCLVEWNQELSFQPFGNGFYRIEAYESQNPYGLVVPGVAKFHSIEDPTIPVEVELPWEGSKDPASGYVEPVEEAKERAEDLPVADNSEAAPDA